MSCGPCLLALSRVDIPGVGQARWCLVAATLSTRSKSFCLAIFSWYIVIESSFSLCHQVCSCLHMCRYTAFPVWPLCQFSGVGEVGKWYIKQGTLMHMHMYNQTME